MPFYEIDGVVPVCDASAFVHPTASVIGDVLIGPNCYIGPGASLRGDFGRIVVGAGSNVQDCCVVHAFPGADAVLEESSHVGHGAVLHGCRIGTNVLVGMNAVVMDGAEIGADSLVGAATFVRAGVIVPPQSLVIGNPAMIRDLDDQTHAWKSNGPKVYEELARRCRTTLRVVTPLAEVEPDRRRVSTGRTVSRPLHEVRRDVTGG